MRNQLLCGALVTMSAMNIMTMELPLKELGHRGATLKEIAVKHLIDHGNSNPCDHMDKLLANEDLYEDLCDDLKNGFCEKYKSCLPDRKIYNTHIAKAMMSANGSSVYVFEKKNIVGESCMIKELDIQSGSLLRIVENSVNLQLNRLMNDFIYNVVDNKEIMVTGSGDGIIKLWNLNDSEGCTQLLDNKKNVKALAANNTNRFCSVSPHEIKTWNIESGTCCMGIVTHGDKRYNEVCMLKNDMLYVGSDEWFDCDLVACDLRSGKSIIAFHSPCITAIADNSQCPYSLFVGSEHCEVKRWDMRKTSEPICAIETEYAVKDIATHGRTLYVALSPGWPQGERPHPGIQVFDIQHKNLSLINNLPGEKLVKKLQVNNAGLCVAGTAGLTIMPTKSYENVYAALKKVNAQKALEYSKK